MRGIPLATPATPVAEVEAAIAAADGRGGRRNVGGTTDFLSAPLSPALRRLAVLYAVYLCIAALRIAEVLTFLAVPKLPMVMALVLAAGLVLAVPGAGWAELWRAAPALRWQTLLVVLAIVTIPLGIWMSNSLERLYPGYLIAVTVFLAGLIVLRDRAVMVRTLQMLTGTLALITVLTVFFGIGAGSVEAGRLTVGVSLDPNDFAWILATFVPIALWLGVRHKATSIFWFGAGLLLVIGIVPTQSRGGFLAVIAAGTVLISFGARGWRRIVMLLAVALLGAVLLAYINASGASRLTDFSSYEGGTGRTELWKQGLKWMVQRPWGFGMGNYATYNVWMTRDGHTGHSAYVNIGVELGVLGLIAFLAIWRESVRGLMGLRRSTAAAASAAGTAGEGALPGFLLAAVAANTVGAIFLNTQYSPLTLFLQSLGIAIAISSQVQHATAVVTTVPHQTSLHRTERPRAARRFSR